jgi:DNA-binding response OmpR family regulator
MSKSILSVNGNRAMNYLLQTIFEKEYQFIPAADVFQGLQQLRSRKNVGALIVDVDFETDQTWELVQHIKSSKLYTIPVIILASQNTETLKQKTYEYEVDEIFFKPFNPIDLIAAIKNVMATVTTMTNT